MTFLRQLSIQGRLRFVQGLTLSGTDDDIITITPNEGETFFIYKLIFSGAKTFAVTNDNMTRLNYVNTTALTVFLFDSLVGDNIKSIVVNAQSGGGVFGSASLLGWVENTSRIRDVAA